VKGRNNKLLKKLDKYFGIPLIFTLGALRIKRRLLPDSLNKRNLRIVLLKTAGIGDTLLVSGVIRELRKLYPDSHITFVCTGTNRAIAEVISEVDQIVLFNLSKPLQSFKLLRSLARFDLLFDFGPWPRINSIISYVLKSRFKVGFKRHGMYRHYIYDRVVYHADNNHEIDNYRNLLKAAGIRPSGVEPSLKIQGNYRDKIDRYFSKANANIILHPFSAGSRAYLKEWPDDRWVELGFRLCCEGFNVMISGGKKDIPRAMKISREMARRDCIRKVIAGRFNLREMAAALQRADLLVSIDTGIMHLGAAVGAEMVALFGPTSPNRWGPRPLGNTLLMTRTNGCRPCLSLGFEDKCSTPCGCIESISVDMVYDAVMRKLGAGEKAKRDTLEPMKVLHNDRIGKSVAERKKQTVS